ncbi:SAM-dependent methyltransferase [Paraglaciecola hydrolytica]|uniref:Cyclopropane-fatty-acyl-phospholipid synthase n=1 Tax=Paraglaciecola hydrolytica TaxID=1799789 RepID=A0A136A3W6_9ALTE|nr:cyclopropane-fatty-acyl-phospholipid synthase family protein [Paraglaciecola hydrolytica]KXI29933.1 cyclopropane-fatty-acyl-phospholipid synthase [Paraglaciecola hydrolytica]
MENTQNLTSPITFSWWTTKCRKALFSVLNDMQQAYIEIHEGKDVHCLGNREAKLSAQITVLDPSLYSDVIKNGSIGAGEAYIAQKWSSPDLTKVIQVFARQQQQLDKLESSRPWLNKLKNGLFHFRNRNSQQGSKKNILAHYDLSNHLYSQFLDNTMTYSSAIYTDENCDLEQAQQNKLKIICEKLALHKDDHLIEIGTGWGGLAIYAASHYGCKVTTTTISNAQYDYAVEQVNARGLQERITLLKQDYRTLDGQYDKLVSIEMIEAVGHEYLPEFFKKCHSLLKDSGKMLLQAITIADSRYDQYRNSVDFIQRYIFPGGCLPSVSVMAHHIAQQSDMVVESVTDIGLHYARTLHDWREAFHRNWPNLNKEHFDQQFKRLWDFYLCYCEGAFIERVISTHHVVARKPQYLGQDDARILAY